ncbi:MAG: hypothetical protein QXZ09_07110, partial [Candidatus Methanomethylicaceae archaeon]
LRAYLRSLPRSERRRKSRLFIEVEDLVRNCGELPVAEIARRVGAPVWLIRTCATASMTLDLDRDRDVVFLSPMVNSRWGLVYAKEVKSLEATYTPTPEEIARETERIRAGWSGKTARRRLRQGLRQWARWAGILLRSAHHDGGFPSLEED